MARPGVEDKTSTTRTRVVLHLGLGRPATIANRSRRHDVHNANDDESRNKGQERNHDAANLRSSDSHVTTPNVVFDLQTGRE
jgi:hypothetical protein